MNIKADIYVQQNTQDPDTGEVKRQWLYEKTIPCKIEPIKVSSNAGNDNAKSFGVGPGREYSEHLQLKIKCLDQLSKRWRVTAIMSSDGKSVYKEIDKYDSPDMIFEVTSSHAVLDPFGVISYHEAMLQRVVVQDNDKN